MVPVHSQTLSGFLFCERARKENIRLQVKSLRYLLWLGIWVWPVTQSKASLLGLVSLSKSSNILSDFINDNIEHLV